MIDPWDCPNPTIRASSPIFQVLYVTFLCGLIATDFVLMSSFFASDEGVVTHLDPVTTQGKPGVVPRIQWSSGIPERRVLMRNPERMRPGDRVLKAPGDFFAALVPEGASLSQAPRWFQNGASGLFWAALLQGLTVLIGFGCLQLLTVTHFDPGSVMIFQIVEFLGLHILTLREVPIARLRALRIDEALILGSGAPRKMVFTSLDLELPEQTTPRSFQCSGLIRWLRDQTFGREDRVLLGPAPSFEAAQALTQRVAAWLERHGFQTLPIEEHRAP